MQQSLEFGGEWTEDKLQILKKYLNAYTTAMKNTRFKLMYVDAFAGTGEVELAKRDSDGERKFVEGSARIATRIWGKPFDKLIFVEQDENRYDSLCKMRDKNKSRNIVAENTDANNYLKGLCGEWRSNHFNWRGVLFLDPFATQVEWETVVAVAEVEALDTWILFPVSGIARMLPIKRMPDDSWARILTRIFGDESWMELYTPSRQRDVFQRKPSYNRDPGVKQIINIYKEKLRGILGERLMDESHPLVNSMNSRLFEFIFFVGSPRGKDLAKRIAGDILKKQKNG